MCWISNLKQTPLKPDQKISILRQNILPKLYHGLQSNRVTDEILKEADRLIRKAEILHLSKDVGLGITSLRLTIPHVYHDRLTRISNFPTETGSENIYPQAEYLAYAVPWSTVEQSYRSNP